MTLWYIRHEFTNTIATVYVFPIIMHIGIRVFFLVNTMSTHIHSVKTMHKTMGFIFSVSPYSYIHVHIHVDAWFKNYRTAILYKSP